MIRSLFCEGRGRVEFEMEDSTFRHRENSRGGKDTVMSFLRVTTCTRATMQSDCNILYSVECVPLSPVMVRSHAHNEDNIFREYLKEEDFHLVDLVIVVGPSQHARGRD